jgi:hypothetical protein
MFSEGEAIVARRERRSFHAAALRPTLLIGTVASRHLRATATTPWLRHVPIHVTGYFDLPNTSTLTRNAIMVAADAMTRNAKVPPGM